MEISDRIKEIIEHYNYTASEFADAIDVPRSSVSHITSGRNRPSLDFVTKIKNRFPELRWDWLIDGQGEMKATTPSENKESEKATARKTAKVSSFVLPDLFNLPEDDFKIANESSKNEDKTGNSNSPESKISSINASQAKIAESQPLEKMEAQNSLEPTDNQKNKIKRIVFFYEDGTFEVYVN